MTYTIKVMEWMVAAYVVGEVAGWMLVRAVKARARRDRP